MNPINHLALDTATDVLSIALRMREAPEPLVTVVDAGLRHTEWLMTVVDELLHRAGVAARDLDLVSCMRGPGSFTGLRIGMATGKGIACGLAAHREESTLPLVSVPTLLVMAAPLSGPRPVIPVIDARKKRFYGACFVAGERLTPDLDLSASDLIETVRSVTDDTPIVTGPHAQAFIEALAGAYAVDADPRPRKGWARELLDLAEAQLRRDGYDTADRGPEYVRSSDAEISRRTRT